MRNVEVSGTIAAGNVDGLESWITTRAATLKGLSENNLTDALKTKIESSQANVIEIVKVNGVAVEVSAEDKSVNIPMATAAALGVVKGTDAENGIASLPQNYSVAVYEAVVAAQLHVSAQTDGTLTFSCDGDVPQIDIPVVVILLG